MKLDKALSAIRSAAEGAVKTASEAPAAEKPAPEKSASEAKLQSALTAALAEAAPEKTAAAAASPVSDLEKLAASVAASEQEALLKEAQAYGVAVADGLMARLAQYNEAAEKRAAEAPAKTASEDSFEKFASENPELVKEAMALGYQSTMQSMEKLAEAAYVKGYQETTEALYKLAAASFAEGYINCGKLIQ